MSISGALPSVYSPDMIRPLSKDRLGTGLGDGAATIIIETRARAEKRNAKIYATVRSIGYATDDYQLTSPSQGGVGIHRALAMALKKAQIIPEDIDYINAHATATPVGDEIEYRVMSEYFPSAIINSNKGNIGHLTGSAGVTELIFTIMAMNNSIVPATANCHEPLDGPLQIANVNVEREIGVAIKNAFGFGGRCCVAMLSKE
jgi:3-oxoacyl-[acyl-carrier-protein] synthase II